MNLEKYFVKVKLITNPTLDKSEMYDFIMTLFENGELEYFLLFHIKYRMTLDASETLTVDAKIQYIHTFLHGEALREFETLCVHIGNMTTLHLNRILLGLGIYIFPINSV